jgi:nucleoside-diphosphate-sugar epimerase
MISNAPHSLSFKSAVVTGGGGFLGKALVKELVSKNIKVTTIQRNHYPELANLGVAQIIADIADPNSEKILLDALKKVDVVFHTAAKVAMWGDLKEFERVNIQGTKQIVEFARKSGIKYFVYTSSPSVIADGTNLRNINESYPYPKHHEAFYPRTKAIAEQFVLSQNDTNFHSLSLRPHLIYGPGDTSLEALVVSRAKAGRLVKIGSGQNLVDFCYIDDCVAAHICAAQALIVNPNCRGRAYFISQGVPTKLWDWIDVALKKNNLPKVSRRVPAWLAKFLGSMLENTAMLSGGRFEPPFTKFLASEMSTDHYFDISAAKNELQFIPAKKNILSW